MNNTDVDKNKEESFDISDMNNILSCLGMLSESCIFRDISEEEKELLKNKQKLATIASVKRKERVKKQKNNAIKELKSRKEETESNIKIYKTKPALDRNGNKIGKRKKLPNSAKKPNFVKYYDEYDKNEYEDCDYYFNRNSESNIKEQEDFYLNSSNNSSIISTEEEELQLALEISKLEQSNNPNNDTKKDIRSNDNIDIGMNVEIVLIGKEETRERTRGIVKHKISSTDWDSKGIIVEIEYGIIGRVTALLDYEFIPTIYTLGINNKMINNKEFSILPDNEEEEEELLWVDKNNLSSTKSINKEENKYNSDVISCPVGCGENLSSLSESEINQHIDICLNKDLIK